MHRCLTAPSMCRGHPVGICDSSRSPLPFCSILSPSIGTSIEVFRLIRGRLHCHVSGESKPRLASSATARTDLLLNESDQALILIRNLPADARQYVLLHAQDDGMTASREAGLKYERQQRLYSELGAVAGNLDRCRKVSRVLNLTVLWMPLERVTGPNVALSVGF